MVNASYGNADSTGFRSPYLPLLFQQIDHAWFSEIRMFMTLIMVAAMMVIMLAFMLGMYKNRAASAVIFIGAQRREIKEMEWLINDIETNGIVETRADAEARPVPDFSGTPE